MMDLRPLGCREVPPTVFNIRLILRLQDRVFLPYYGPEHRIHLWFPCSGNVYPIAQTTAQEPSDARGWQPLPAQS